VAKRRHIDRPVQKCIMLPESVVAAVEKRISDPLLDRAPHGAWSRLVGGLLQEWLRRNSQETSPNVPLDFP
jgi:hypothetical protein